MYPRIINILKSKSFFLFGARNTGKSHLLRQQFAAVSSLWIDLLSDREFVRYNSSPDLLTKQVKSLASEALAAKPWIVIDEVQRVPKLLNEVHLLLEDQSLHGKVFFALSRSSARKLKRGGANLLAGRALVNALFPLTFKELGSDFCLDEVLNWGSLPDVISQPEQLVRAEQLESYYYTYLREEIREEQVVRQLDPFTRFLETAALSSGHIVNYAAIGRDCQVDPKSVARYYQILEDTLLGMFLPSYHRSIRKQQTASSRFYLFDLGVQRALQGTLNVPITSGSYTYERAFEQFVILEIHRLNTYLRKRYRLYYLRTKDNNEIDLIIERPGQAVVIIEIKSTEHVNEQHAKSLRTFLKDFEAVEAYVLSRDEKSQEKDGVYYVHWQKGIEKLFFE